MIFDRTSARMRFYGSEPFDVKFDRISAKMRLSPFRSWLLSLFLEALSGVSDVGEGSLSRCLGKS